MTRNVKLAFWAGAIVAVALAVVIGPLFAGYVVAGASLVVIAALMIAHAVRAIDNWRLDHPVGPWVRQHMPRMIRRHRAA